MTKLATLAMLLIAAVAAHPGHGNVINAEQKSAWTAAFAAKRAHLASQVKFHTSELLRYKNRDAQYEAIEAVWSGEGSVVDHFKSTLTVSNDFRIKENAINKVVTVNQTARRPLLDKYYKLLKVAMATKQVRRMETADAVTAAYKKWIDTSKSANSAEQAFHNVEFKEFEGEEACIKEAETRMADAATLDEDMRYYYGQCMKKVREEIKKEVVNVADQNRKVGRKDLGKLWMAFVKAGYEFVASEGQKAMAEQRAANVAKNAAAKAVRGMRALAKQSPATRRQLSSKYQEAVRDLKAYLDKF
jgi:hypothetical protein